MEDRVAALEAKVGDKSIAEQFREQAELIDRMLAYRFEESDRKWDAKLETKLETKLEEKLQPIRTDLAAVKDAVRLLVERQRHR